jgi:hypothetical protein
MKKRRADRRTLRPRVLLSAVITFVLLAAEAFAVVHPLDLAAHATDEPCAICVSVASFGSANVAPAADFAIVRSKLILPTDASTRAGVEVPSYYLARAPPHAS